MFLQIFLLQSIESVFPFLFMALGQTNVASLFNSIGHGDAAFVAFQNVLGRGNAESRGGTTVRSGFPFFT